MFWCNMEWKSWNITGIQVGSGESRTSEDAAVLESRSRSLRVSSLSQGCVDLHYVLVT